jgi:23S rRNA (uracil1939-C5)-methyltransferase
MEIKIRDISQEGQGIGTGEEGKVFFVDGALPGERVEAEVLGKNRARALTYKTHSADRVEPPCPFFGRCGACQIQHLAYPASLRWKYSRVYSCLERIGQIPTAVLDTRYFGKAPGAARPSPQLWHYRNNCRYQLGVENGRLVSGFYEAKSKNIVDQGQLGCLLATSLTEKMRLDFVSFVDQNPDAFSFLPDAIQIRNNHDETEVLVSLLFSKASQASWEKRLGFWKIWASHLETSGSLDGQKISVVISNSNGPRRQNILLGRPFLEESMAETKQVVEASSFFQVNSGQALYMQKRLLTLLEERGLPFPKEVWDIYGGTGSLGLLWAKQGAKVKVFELNPLAEEMGMKQARLNNVADKFSYFLGDAGREVPSYVSESKGPDLIITDPPRQGLSPALIEALAGTKTPNWLYVSCDPSTLARDLKSILAKGYELKAWEVLDMFPWSTHVETVVLMSRVDK